MSGLFARVSQGEWSYVLAHVQLTVSVESQDVAKRPHFPKGDIVTAS